MTLQRLLIFYRDNCFYYSIDGEIPRPLRLNDRVPHFWSALSGSSATASKALPIRPGSREVDPYCSQTVLVPFCEQRHRLLRIRPEGAPPGRFETEEYSFWYKKERLIRGVAIAGISFLAAVIFRDICKSPGHRTGFSYTVRRSTLSCASDVTRRSVPARRSRRSTVD